MTSRIRIEDLKKRDERFKPGNFAGDAIDLAALSENRGRAITYSHLRRVAMGDPDNSRPLCVGSIPRLQDSLSVLYRTPATRRLKRGREFLSDDSPDAEAFQEMSRRMLLDNVWQLVDARRNLTRQCAVSFTESHAHQSVQARVFWPFEVFRSPTPGAADIMDEDEAVAFQLVDSPRPEECVYQLWQHEGDGWRFWIVDGSDRLVGPQPYGESGKPSFEGLPVVMVYDSLPAGAAWLPIPESRLDFALNVNALANDLAYLVKLEAHTLKVAITDDAAMAKPTSVGPDKLMILPGGSDMKLLAHNPQIAAVNDTIAHQLAMLAISESLPADYFARDRQVRTGPALKVAERDLESRRQRQSAPAQETERIAFAKYRAIHNAFASAWGVAPIAEDLTLSVSFNRQFQPTDAKDLQETWFKDLAIGAASIIGYLQERYNLDRPGAIELYEQIQEDRETFVVAAQQNPAALVDGPNPAVGTEGAEKVPGALNPDVATSTDGASVTDAVMSGMSPAASSQIVAPAEAKAQDTALNGAQVTSALEIIQAVAGKKLPRDTGVNMLIEFFNLDPARAERVMGSVGRGFTVEPEPAKQGPFQQTPDKIEPEKA